MTAPRGGLTISMDKLMKIIAEGLGGEPITAETVDLGGTGRKFTRNFAFTGDTPRFHEFEEQASFNLCDLLDYDDMIELDDDELQFIVEDAVLDYVKKNKDQWRSAVLHHAEAFKQEMLTHPAGE